MTDIRQAVTRYRHQGYSVCRLEPGEKRPSYCRWPTFSYGAGSFQDGHGVGLITGRINHNLVCVDLDDRRLLPLADRYLPDTDLIDGRPGKPGSHRWYRVVDIPAALASHGCLIDGGPVTRHFDGPDGLRLADLLGTGAQAAVPPTRWMTGDGSRRELRHWDRDGEPAVVGAGELYQAVEQLVSQCGWQPQKRAAAPKVCYGFRVAGDVIGQAIRYLTKLPAAISGAGGHRLTFWAARIVVYGFALGPSTGYDLLAQHYNPRCSPPWQDTELRHKCREANERPMAKPRGFMLCH